MVKKKQQMLNCLATEQLRIEKKLGGLVAKAYLFIDYKEGESWEDVLCLHVQSRYDLVGVISYFYIMYIANFKLVQFSFNLKVYFILN